MSELLKISVLNVNDEEEMEQFSYLFTKFIISEYVKNKLKKVAEPEIMQKITDEYNGKCKPSILTNEDIMTIKRTVEPTIVDRKNLLLNNRENIENRCYILKNNNKIVGFQMVQLIKTRDGRMSGNISSDSYIEPEYEGKSGDIINNSDAVRNGIYSEILYEDIAEWFGENNVYYERTSIDVSKLSSIESCIKLRGFLPFDKNRRHIFLEKYRDYPISEEVLERVDKLYVKNMRRTESKSFNELMLEIDQEIEEIGADLVVGAENEEMQNFIEQCKRGLAIAFMNNEEMELFDLNNFIGSCLKSPKREIPYNLLYELSKTMFIYIKVKDRQIKESEKPSTIENSKEIALEFFKSIDVELYEKAKSIIEGNSNIDFEAYEFNDNDNNRPKNGIVVTKSGKSTVYIPYKGTIDDIYLIVHELSHTFDLDPKGNPPTRYILAEVTASCFELMLDEYLTEKGIVSKEDVANRQKEEILKGLQGMTFAKLELMYIKMKRNIKREDILNFKNRYELSDEEMRYVLNDILTSPRNADYDAKYMMALLISSHYIEQYDKNPQKAIENLKQFFELEKADDFTGALKMLEVDMSSDKASQTIMELVDRVNRNLNEIEQIRAGGEISNASQNFGNSDIDDDGDR